MVFPFNKILFFLLFSLLFCMVSLNGMNQRSSAVLKEVDVNDLPPDILYSMALEAKEKREKLSWLSCLVLASRKGDPRASLSLAQRMVSDEIEIDMKDAVGFLEQGIEAIIDQNNFFLREAKKACFERLIKFYEEGIGVSFKDKTKAKELRKRYAQFLKQLRRTFRSPRDPESEPIGSQSSPCSETELYSLTNSPRSGDESGLESPRKSPRRFSPRRLLGKVWRHKRSPSAEISSSPRKLELSLRLGSSLPSSPRSSRFSPRSPITSPRSLQTSPRTSSRFLQKGKEKKRDHISWSPRTSNILGESRLRRSSSEANAVEQKFQDEVIAVQSPGSSLQSFQKGRKGWDSWLPRRSKIILGASRLSYLRKLDTVGQESQPENEKSIVGSDKPFSLSDELLRVMRFHLNYEI